MNPQSASPAASSRFTHLEDVDAVELMRVAAGNRTQPIQQQLEFIGTRQIAAFVVRAVIYCHRISPGIAVRVVRHAYRSFGPGACPTFLLSAQQQESSVNSGGLPVLSGLHQAAIRGRKRSMAVQQKQVFRMKVT